MIGENLRQLKKNQWGKFSLLEKKRHENEDKIFTKKTVKSNCINAVCHKHNITNDMLKTVLGKMPPGKMPPGKMALGKVLPGKLPPRKMAPPLPLKKVFCKASSCYGIS